jgi:hypothetical protein
VAVQIKCDTDLRRHSNAKPSAAKTSLPPAALVQTSPLIVGCRSVFNFKALSLSVHRHGAVNALIQSRIERISWSVTQPFLRRVRHSKIQMQRRFRSPRQEGIGRLAHNIRLAVAPNGFGTNRNRRWPCSTTCRCCQWCWVRRAGGVAGVPCPDIRQPIAAITVASGERPALGRAVFGNAGERIVGGPFVAGALPARQTLFMSMSAPAKLQMSRAPGAGALADNVNEAARRGTPARNRKPTTIGIHLSSCSIQFLTQSTRHQIKERRGLAPPPSSLASPLSL